MPTLHFTRPKESLHSLAQRYGVKGSIIPQLAQHHCCHVDKALPLDEMVVLPHSESEIRSREYQSLLEWKRHLRPDMRQTLSQYVNNHGSEAFQSAGQWWANQSPYNDETKAMFEGLLSARHLRNQEMQKAIKQYNKALLNYRNVNSYNRFSAQKEVIDAFKQVNKHFQSDIRQLKTRHRKPHRNPLHNLERAMNIAADSRRAIQLNSLAEVQHLQRIIKNTDFSIRGLMILDLGLAGNKIHNTYQMGGNATLKAFEELGSIIGGVISGLMISNALVLIPGVGILLAAGLFVVGALVGSYYGKKLGSKLYNISSENNNNTQTRIFSGFSSNAY